jgi:hypothetical protein
MRIHNDKLAAKIAARNRVNRLAIDTVPAMVAALKPFIGKKVLNAGTVLSKAVRDALPDDQCAGKGASANQWFYRASAYSLSVEFQVQEAALGGHWRDGSSMSERWHRGTTTACLGEIKNGILTTAANSQTWRTDYNRAEIEKNRFAFEASRRAMEDAESALAGFGTYDN